MKTNDLIRIAKQIGYIVSISPANEETARILFHQNGHLVAHIARNQQKDVVIVDASRVSDDLFLTVTRYAVTPKEEREDEERYRLQLDAPAAGLPVYLSKTNGIGGTNLNVWRHGKDNSHLLYTEKQLENIDIKGFKKEPYTI